MPTTINGLKTGVRGQDEAAAQRATALLPWFAALANRENTPASILWLSDSKQFMGATTWASTYIGALGRRLRTKFPVTGAPGPASGLNWIPATTGVAAAGSTTDQGGTLPPAFTYGGSGLSVNTLYGLGRASAQITSTIGPATSSSSSGLFTGLTSIRAAAHQTGSAGNMTVTINGGTANTFATAGAGAEIRSASYAMTGGTDSVVVAYSTGTTNQFEGLFAYNGDEAKGINVYPSSHFGWNTSQWANQTPPDGLGLQWVTPWLTTLGISCVGIDLGSNDWIGTTNPAITPAQTQANLETIVTALSAATAVPPTILLTCPTQRSGITNSATWAQYVTAIQAVVANHPNTVVCDLNLRLPTAASDPSGSPLYGLFSDAVHFSNKGHSMVADTLLAVLSPH